MCLARARVALRNEVTGLVFVSPWIVGLLVFTLYPLLASLFYSFTD